MSDEFKHEPYRGKEERDYNPVPKEWQGLIMLPKIHIKSIQTFITTVLNDPGASSQTKIMADQLNNKINKFLNPTG